jgi:hypothetical protein
MVPRFLPAHEFRKASTPMGPLEKKTDLIPWMRVMTQIFPKRVVSEI